MQSQNEPGQAIVSEDLIDALIRAGLIAAMAVLCFRIFSPFLGLMVWGLILAITIYPLHQRLARSFGGSRVVLQR